MDGADGDASDIRHVSFSLNHRRQVLLVERVQLQRINTP